MALLRKGLNGTILQTCSYCIVTSFALVKFDIGRNVHPSCLKYDTGDIQMNWKSIEK